MDIILLGPPGAGKGTQATRFARERGLARVATGDILRDAIKAETPLGQKVQATIARGELVDDETMIEMVRERLARPDAQKGFLLDGFPRTVPQAQALDAIMKAGELVPDEIVDRLIHETLEAMGPAQGAIFDGYPRTLIQARSLDRLLAEHGRRLDAVIELEVDEEALVDRITGRFTCATCGEGYHDRYKLPRLPGVCDVCGAEDSFKRRADDNEAAVRTRMAEYRAKTAPILPYYEARNMVSRVDGMASMDEVYGQLTAILDRS